MGLLHRGEVVGSEDRRYVVQRKLGEGQFAEVWEVKPSGSSGDVRYALKLEKRRDRSTVRAEYKLLKRLSGLCSQVVAVLGCGTHDERFFMVLQLLGETLFDARRGAGGRLDPDSVRGVGLSTLTAIQQLHEQQHIHRDIKPANFVVHPPNAAPGKGSWLLIDFGLARRYTDESGVHLPRRADASFRGSTTYASVHAHREQDLSRRDDLWSWLYMLAELLDGGLPWRQEKDAAGPGATAAAAAEAASCCGDARSSVLTLKEACMAQPELLARSTQLPEALTAISRHLAGLSFEQTPDYDHLRACLQQLPSSWLPLPLLQAAAVDTQQPLQQQQQQQPARQRSWPEAVDGGAGGVAHALAAKRPHPDCSSTPPDPGGQHKRPREGDSSTPQRSPADDNAGAAADRAAGHWPSSRSETPPSTGRPPLPVSGSRGAAELLLQERSAAGQDGGAPHTHTTMSSRLPGAAGNSMHVNSAAAAAPASCGSAADIADLLTALQGEAGRGARAAADVLCGLPPLAAVGAIGLTLDRVVDQSDAACLPAVSQLLADLAAFAAAGASRAAAAAALGSADVPALRQQQQQQAKQQQQQHRKHTGAVGAGPAAR